jgi:Myb-like DNA-binding domain
LFCFLSQEDLILRQTIESSDCQWKWPVIAKAIPGRSGKQCRERYLNHLKPSLKLDSWSLMEDARLYHVYHSAGSKWAMIAKLLPGRTDNSVKNRFHHLSRRLEKRFAHDDNSTNDTTTSLAAATTQQKLERKLLDSSLFRRIKVDNLELKCVIAHAMHKATPKAIQDPDDQKKIGPFRPCKSAGEMCKRCNLQIPSTQTGRLVCETTLWCYTCAHISPHMGCGDLARAVHWIGKLSSKDQVLKL